MHLDDNLINKKIKKYLAAKFEEMNFIFTFEANISASLPVVFISLK